MPAKFVHPEVKRAAVRLTRNFSPQETAAMLNISDDTVRRAVKLHNATGDVVTVSSAKPGRKPKLSESDLEILESALQIHCDFYLDELQVLLETTTGTMVSLPTILRALNSMGITNKAVTRAASERNPIKRAHYSLEISQYQSNQLVFLDQCYVDKRSTARATGWSRKGHRATVQAPFLRGHRYSVLPALSLDGILDIQVVDGTVNGDIFVDFIEGLALQMRPFPEKNSVLVMDNVKFHHDARVSSILEERGIHLVYLPPYSPDFNPIEEMFSCLKAWIRRNNSVVREAMESSNSREAPTLLMHATIETAEPAKCAGWFRDSGYF